MIVGKRWAWSWAAPAATLAAALAVAACTSAPASSGPPSAGGAARTSATAITAAQASQVFDRYVAAAAATVSQRSASLQLSLSTGVERAVLAAMPTRPTIVSDGAASSNQGAYRSSLSVTVNFSGYTYGPPTFYLPAATGYPRFFVASVTQTLRAPLPAGGATPEVGDARVPLDGPTLMLFEQARAGASWLLASSSRLAAGASLPKLATDGAGHVETVPLGATALLAPPDDVGPLQAAVVDDGPASAAAATVAGGPLSTGMYQGARVHPDGLTAPRGDVYQWELDGVSYPEFALRTAASGAVVFYAMALNTTVAVPDVIDKGDPIRSGPPIQVPLDLRVLLPADQATPLIQLQSEQTLSFAAVDPAPGNSKIQVIAIGGGLTSASAS